MSTLAKEIIEKLSNEEDMQVLAEVLDFYDYLKYKKNNESKNDWDIREDNEPIDEEKRLSQEYKDSKEELNVLNDLIKEINLNE